MRTCGKVRYICVSWFVNGVFNMKEFFQTHLKKVSALTHVQSGNRADVSLARDWYLALISTSLLAAIFLGLGVYQYWRATAVLGEEPDASIKEVDVDLGSVQSLVAVYRARREAFESLQKSAPMVPDVGMREVISIPEELPVANVQEMATSTVQDVMIES